MTIIDMIIPCKTLQWVGPVKKNTLYEIFKEEFGKKDDEKKGEVQVHLVLFFLFLLKRKKGACGGRLLLQSVDSRSDVCL